MNAKEEINHTLHYNMRYFIKVAFRAFDQSENLFFLVHPLVTEQLCAVYRNGLTSLQDITPS